MFRLKNVRGNCLHSARVSGRKCFTRSRPAQLIKRLPPISLYLLGKTISPVPFAKDLGVYIDQYLTYDVHITKTASSCMNQLIHIRRIKHLLDKKTLLLLINSFAFSKLYCCNSIVPRSGGTHLNVIYTNCSWCRVLQPELY